MKAWARWALVTRNIHGQAKIERTFLFRAVAVRQLAERNRRRSTWNQAPALPRLEMQVADHGPRVLRRMRVMGVLAERGPLSLLSLAGQTAMSPRTVEQELLWLGREGWVVCRTVGVVQLGEERPVTVWRPCSREEWAARQPPPGRPQRPGLHR